MNRLGRLLTLSLFGESHGPCVGLVLDGCPAGLPLCAEDFAHDIARRKPSAAAGGTQRREEDKVRVQSGVWEGHSTGTPITLVFENKDIRSGDYKAFQDTPRPGHADWVAGVKYGGYSDPRGGGHFSGRLTLPLVAAGVIAKKLIAPVQVQAWLEEVGGESDIDKGLKKAQDAQDSVGGLVKCVADHMPAGLGEPFFDSLESTLSHAIFAIPAIKGIAFGSGFAAAGMFGSEHNDVFVDTAGGTKSNHAGGIVGGISNGNALSFRVAVKPTASTPQGQYTLDMKKNEQTLLHVGGRHDLCIAMRVPVVLEAITACVLADSMLLAQKIPTVYSPTSIHLKKPSTHDS